MMHKDHRLRVFRGDYWWHMEIWQKAKFNWKYIDDDLMIGNFATNMDQFIIDNPQIQLWIHGHTHDPFDYGIGGTRVLCNPRGYIQYEQRAQEFELQYVDLF